MCLVAVQALTVMVRQPPARTLVLIFMVSSYVLDRAQTALTVRQPPARTLVLIFMLCSYVLVRA